MKLSLALIKQEKFGNITCDLYKNRQDEILMTREQIGKGLEYNNPSDAIYRIHERHKNRLDKFSVIDNLSSTDSKKYETYLYTSKGIYEICRWSQQKKADEFMDWAWEVIDNIRKFLIQKQSQEWQETRSLDKTYTKHLNDAIREFVEYAKSQGSQNANHYYNHFARLANQSAGITNGQRDFAETRKLTNQTYINELLKRTILEEIEKKVFYKDIFQLCKARIEQLNRLIPLRIAN